MLFLGAGASRAVGVPDLRGLTDVVINRLEQEGYGDLIHHIIDTLESSNLGYRFFNQGEIDIEVIFSVLNGRLDNTNSLKELGPFGIYLNELGRNPTLPYSGVLQNRQELSRIREIVGEVITKLCNSFHMDKATSYYAALFEFEKQVLARQQRRLFSHIVTTNYDLVLERCAMVNPDIRAQTGFERDSNSQEDYLPLQKICLGDGRYYLEEIKYLKLHGSINWWIRERDKLIIRRDSAISLMGELTLNS